MLSFLWHWYNISFSNIEKIILFVQFRDEFHFELASSYMYRNILFYIHWRKSREDFTENDEAKSLNLNWFFDWRLSCRRSNLMLNLLHNYAINLQVISRGINLHANSQRTNFVAKTVTKYNQPRKLIYYVNSLS